MRRAVPRLATSVGLIGMLLAVCLRVPNLHRATVALMMVLIIVGLAKLWGWMESLLAAVVGGIGFVYYFLPPRGLHIDTFEDFADVIALLVTGIVTGQLVARSTRLRREAEQRENELEKLYRLSDEMLSSGGPELSLMQLADRLAEIFGAGGIALYDKHTGQIARSGKGTDAISDQALYQTAERALDVPRLVNAAAAFSVVPIRHGGELVGSIGMGDAKLSEALRSAVAERVGLGLTRLYANEKTVEAEVARRAEELKSAVLDAMAHEIRNPLNSAKLAATTLLSEHAGSEVDKREMLTIIDEELDRMGRFIDEAVLLARMEAGDFPVNKEPQDLAHLIPAAVKEMHAQASRRLIQVSVPESLPPAECDKDMIARVLHQLLSNALKYSPEDSPLAVSAEFTGAAVVIHVVDHGPGVDDEERDRIFEKYYRGRAARSGAPGTGLGLASARSIIRAHGGEIWVSSPAAGGAAFHVSLPAKMAGHMLGGE